MTATATTRTPRRIVRNEALTPREKLDLLEAIRLGAAEDADHRVAEVATDDIDEAIQQVRRDADALPVGEIWRTN